MTLIKFFSFSSESFFQLLKPKTQSGLSFLAVLGKLRHIKTKKINMRLNGAHEYDYSNLKK